MTISGGGSKGAWAGGLAQYLVQGAGNHYDIVVGTSTGSLLAPLVATEDFAKLRTAYTSVTQKDIFKVNPFKKNSPNMEINWFAVVYNLFVRRQKTFGDSSPMLDLIKRFFSDADYEGILSGGKRVVSCVSNLSTSQMEYHDIGEGSYEDFCDWMRASASFTPFMSLVEKNGFGYADGGIFSPLPLQRAIDLGADVVDVIVLDPKQGMTGVTSVGNVFAIISAMMGCMDNQLRADDVEVGFLLARDKDVTLNVYFTPTQLTYNSLMFDQKTMSEWWQQGYDFGRANQPQIKTVIRCKR